MMPGQRGCRSLRRNLRNTEHRIDAAEIPAHNPLIMAKGNGEQSSNGSGLEIEAQLIHEVITAIERELFPIPTGLRPSAQSCPVSGTTLGNMIKYFPQPQRGCITPVTKRYNLVGNLCKSTCSGAL
jgi:hypothetical protein